MAELLGPPDLLLISGDLANRGDPKEYDRVDRLLDTLLGWLREAAGGPPPLIAAVPVRRARYFGTPLFFLFAGAYRAAAARALAARSGLTRSARSSSGWTTKAAWSASRMR